MGRSDSYLYAALSVEDRWRLWFEISKGRKAVLMETKKQTFGQSMLAGRLAMDTGRTWSQGPG